MTPNVGQVVADEIFASKRIRIYSQGFIQISGAIFGSKSAVHERLLSIEDSGDVQKKSALGRTAGAALTGGASWLLSSNKRGDVYLTIVTDRETYVLHQDPPTDGGIKAAKRLGAAGRACLQSPQDPSGNGGVGAAAPRRSGSPASGDSRGPRVVITTEDSTYELREDPVTPAGIRAVDRLLEEWRLIQDEGDDQSGGVSDLRLSTKYDGAAVVLYGSSHIRISFDAAQGGQSPAERLIAIEAIYLQEATDDGRPSSEVTPIEDVGRPAQSLVEQLRELKVMLNEGLISDDEYESLRSKAMRDSFG